MRENRRPPYVCLPVRGQSFWDPNRPDNRRTALREAAYIRRTKFEKNDLVHDFSCRAEDLFMMTPILPSGAPAWAHRPFLRWKMADEAVEQEAGSDSLRAWHVCADLPVGLSRGRWVDMTEDLVRSALPACAVAEICGHLPVQDPAHIHLLVAARTPGEWRYGTLLPELEACLNVRLKQHWLAWLEQQSHGGPLKKRLAA